jgi:hypothetical protein
VDSDPKERELLEDHASAEADAEERRLAAQEAAREQGAQTLDLELGEELDLSPAPAAPKIEVLYYSGDAEAGDALILKVGGEERARVAVSDVDPDVLAQAKAEPDPRRQAALLWPEPPAQSKADPDPGPAGDADAKPGDVSAAEGLKAQMAAAEGEQKGTAYVIFRHGVTTEPAAAASAVQVKDLAGGTTELESLAPIASGRFTGAPAALVAAREEFGEGEYAAIPLRNITVKAWKRVEQPRWV